MYMIWLWQTYSKAFTYSNIAWVLIQEILYQGTWSYLEKELFHGNQDYKKYVSLSTIEVEFIITTDASKEKL